MARLIQRGLRRAYGLLRTGVLPALSAPIGWARDPRQVVARFPASGPIPLGPRVAIFCHYDGVGRVRPRVFAYLAALRAERFSVLFVSNAGALDPDDRARLEAECAGVLVRRNVGYDFGAWRDALEQAALPRADTAMLLLCNDSVFGPLRPLAGALARVDFSRADVWGLTESWQSQYHLQSYFLAVAPGVLTTAAWRRFWSGVRPTPSKHWIIRRYEIGFTRVMRSAGLRCAAAWPYAELVAAIPRPIDLPTIADVLHDANARRIAEKASRDAALNPSSDLWRELLSLGFPFLKRELLRDNPARVPDVADWRAAVAPVATPEALSLLDDEVAETGRMWPRRRPGDRRRR